jgi:hypothetical protein
MSFMHSRPVGFNLEGHTPMLSCLWWAKMILMALFSIFFLVFGIETLIGAFHLKNPLEFIMYFFSSNLIILVSVVGIIYPAFKIHLRVKK